MWIMYFILLDPFSFPLFLSLSFCWLHNAMKHVKLCFAVAEENLLAPEKPDKVNRITPLS